MKTSNSTYSSFHIFVKLLLNFFSNRKFSIRSSVSTIPPPHVEPYRITTSLSATFFLFLYRNLYLSTSTSFLLTPLSTFVVRDKPIGHLPRPFLPPHARLCILLFHVSLFSQNCSQMEQPSLPSESPSNTKPSFSTDPFEQLLHLLQEPNFFSGIHSTGQTLIHSNITITVNRVNNNIKCTANHANITLPIPTIHLSHICNIPKQPLFENPPSWTSVPSAPR